jgi:hypothetical protein
VSDNPGLSPLEAEAPPPLASGPTGGDVLIALGAIIGAFILLILATLLLSGREGDWGMVAQIAVGNAVLLAGIGALLARRGSHLAVLLGLTALKRRQAIVAALVGGGAGFGMAAALYVLQTWTGLHIHATQRTLLSTADLSPGEIAILVLLVGLTGPAIEELVFRGVLFGWLRRWIGPWLGALASAIPFGLLHLPAGQAVWATLFGLLLAILYQRFGSLWAPMLAHSANNCLTLAVIFTAVEGVPG